LKYQVKPRDPRSSSNGVASKLHRNSSLSMDTPPPRPAHRTLIHIRNGPPSCSSSNSSGSMSDLNSPRSLNSTPPPAIRLRSTSLSSLSSIDSFDSADWGYLRVFTRGIKADTDYKTIKITSNTSALTVIELVLSKFRLTYRDPNLFRLCMEIKTRHMAEFVKTILELDDSARPLELQRCQPQNMARFFVLMVNDCVLTRIDDSTICPQSNYKSVLLSRRTTVLETIRILLQMCRVMNADETHYKLCLSDPEAEIQLPYDVCTADVFTNLGPSQKLVLRRID